MIPSVVIAKSRLINILKIDHLEADQQRGEMVISKVNRISLEDFRNSLMERTTANVEDIYKYVFTCVPNKYTKDSLINELVEEYRIRLNRNK